MKKGIHPDYHVIEVKNPMELFRTRFHTIEAARLKEAV